MIPKGKEAKMWIGFWEDYIHLSFFRDIFGHIVGEGAIHIKKEEDLEKLPLCVGRDIIKNILAILPGNGSVNVGVNAKRSFNISWPGLSYIRWPSAESRIIECIRKVLRYSKKSELATSKRLELYVAFPAGKTIVNIDFSNNVFYLQFVGRDIFHKSLHKSLPHGRALKIGDLIPVTDNEQILLKKLIRIAGKHGNIRVSDSRNVWIEIGKASPLQARRKKGFIIEALKDVFGNKTENLPLPKRKRIALIARMSFRFDP